MQFPKVSILFLAAVTINVLVSAANAKSTRIYVGNNGATTVSVIDHGSRTVIETIELEAQPHSSVPAHAGDRIYVTTQDSGEVIAIDTRNNEILWRAKAGENLHTPTITPDDRFVFAPEWEGGRLAIVDTQSGQLVDEVEMIDPDTNDMFTGLHNTYALGDGVHLLAGSIFDEVIIKVNMTTRDIVRIYPVGGQPRPFAITKDMSTAFVQLSELNGFIALDLETGDVIKRIEWPYDSELPKYVDSITPSHGIGLTIDDSELWAASSYTSQLYVYSVPQLEKLAVVDVGLLPNWIAVSNDGKTLYVTCQEPAKQQGVVAVIDIASRQVMTFIDVGYRPKKIHLLDLPES